MLDDKLFKQLDSFIAQAQTAIEAIRAGDYLGAALVLDDLLRDINKYRNEKEQYESQCL